MIYVVKLVNDYDYDEAREEFRGTYEECEAWIEEAIAEDEMWEAAQDEGYDYVIEQA